MIIENEDGTTTSLRSPIPPAAAEHTISKQRIADLLFCAFEGGSNYWLAIKHSFAPPVLAFRVDPDRLYTYVDYPLNEGGSLLIETNDLDEIDGKTEWTFNYEAIKQGLVTLQEKFPDHFKDFIEENEDADTGDMFLQCCLFGNVVFS